ncbi:MAG: HPP family protein [Gammaproteobacteria bacterium]
MKKLLGVQIDVTPHKEKLISAVGGFIAIYAILFFTRLSIPGTTATLIVASMGASAVLLFAVPHGPLSQPWPVFGGHVISAVIGVTLRLLVPDLLLAAALAVGLSIAVMYYLRCIHPPGGATALAAVVAGSEIEALGYGFVLTPVMLNAGIILLVAWLVNYPFAWRRYPAVLSTVETTADKLRKSTHGHLGRIPRRDLEYALKSMQSFADISEQELENIYLRASQHAMDMHLKPEDIKLGHYYIHGPYAGSGVVRRIIDESVTETGTKDMVIYKVITGPERQTTATCTREAFASWARHEVEFIDEQWQIIEK